MTFRDSQSDSERPDIPPSRRTPAAWDPDDPRWSAYLLGEMSPADRLAVEAILEDNPGARSDFEELADAADLVRLAFETAPVGSVPSGPAPDDMPAPSATAATVVPVLPSKRRLGSGGRLAFLSVAASLGLCLMLVGQNPSGRRPENHRLAMPAVKPRGTDDALSFALTRASDGPTTALATAVNGTAGVDNSTQNFRLTPSLALSYYDDSLTAVDSLAVSVLNSNAAEGSPAMLAADKRLRHFGEEAGTAGRVSGEAVASRFAFKQDEKNGSSERGRGADRPDVSENAPAAVAALEQRAKTAEPTPAATAEPALREVLLVSRFQTPATVPVAAIPIQVGRQTMSDVERSLTRGEWPAPESIRLEEMVNAFDYDDPLPAGDEIAQLRVEAGACPWNERHRLVRIGLRAEPIDLARRPTLRAVFVVDSRRPEMLTWFNKSLAEASPHFSSLDRVTVFDAAGTLALPTVAGDELENKLRGLQVEAEGVRTAPVASPPAPAASTVSAAPVPRAGTVQSLPKLGKAATDGAARQTQLALENAITVARKTFVAGANNSVVFLTDEPLQPGEAEQARLMQKAQSVVDSGVNLSVVDVNANYGNPVLYSLVNVGNGSVNTVSTPDELSEAVVQELAGGKSVVATDVELQVEFNPVRVEAYRLLGYEHWDRGSVDPRLLAAQKELRAGDRLCAVIEVRLNPETNSTLASLPLRYRQSNEFFVDADIRDGEPPAPPVNHETEWLTARLLYTPSGSSLQAVREVPFDGDTGATSAALDWAACVVDFGERLKQPDRLTTASLQGIRRRAQQAAGADPLGTRQKFLNVLDQAIELTGRTSQPPASPAALSSGEARTRATCGGHYRDLLDKIAVPADHARYGVFHDLGFQSARTYQGHADLPAGHWVYVYPHWYIWGAADEQIFMAAPPPPAQAVPAPQTP